MNIKRGNLYMNRTWTYLFPLLKYYGIDLETHIKSFMKLAVGISDFNNTHTEPTFCILFDVSTSIQANRPTELGEDFANFLDWVRLQDYYLDDYMYDVDDTQLHMLVIKFPEKYLHVYDKFILGEYSEMYTQYELDTYFGIIPNPRNDGVIDYRNKHFKQIRNVLLRDPERKKEFVKIVNEKFQTNVEEHFFEDSELDFAPNLAEEIFSYELEK